MNPAELMQGIDWRGCAPGGWLVNEKLDGWFARWDGAQLWTKEGNLYRAPEWFTAALPAGVCLDGELYSGQGCNDVSSRVRRKDTAGWTGLEFIAFDVPGAVGSYGQRMAAAPAGVRRTGFEQCDGPRHLRTLLDAVKGRGGEGLMIRDPLAPYTPGRVAVLQKVKVWVL